MWRSQQSVAIEVNNMGFIIGLMLGGTLGLFFMAALQINKE